MERTEIRLPYMESELNHLQEYIYIIFFQKYFISVILKNLHYNCNIINVRQNVYVRMYHL